MSEVSIYQFLSEEEATELVRQLNSSGISANRGGMTSGEGDYGIYQVYIDSSEIENVEKIISQFQKYLKSKVAFGKFSCNRCKANLPNVEIVKDLSFLRKLLSLGTQLVKCKKCENEWYI